MSRDPVNLASRAAASVVAGVAGYASYNHIVEVATRAGEHPSVASILPASIDGLIVVGTMAMVADRRAGRRPRSSARVALVAGVVATLAANIASAQPTTTARAVAAVPAVAFLLAVEVLTRRGRRADEQPHEQVTTTTDGQVHEQPGEQINPVTDEQIREQLSIPARRVPRKRAQGAQPLHERVRAAHEQSPEATHQQLAEQLGVSVSTVRRARAARAGQRVNGSPEEES